MRFTHLSTSYHWGGFFCIKPFVTRKTFCIFADKFTLIDTLIYETRGKSTKENRPDVY